MASFHAYIYGRVQGVFFRSYLAKNARELGLVGYVRNLPSGAVEVMAEGEWEHVNKLVERLKVGPPTAIVERVKISWSEYTGGHSGFGVRY